MFQLVNAARFWLRKPGRGKGKLPETGEAVRFFDLSFLCGRGGPAHACLANKLLRKG